MKASRRKEENGASNKGGNSSGRVKHKRIGVATTTTPFKTMSHRRKRGEFEVHSKKNAKTPENFNPATKRTIEPPKEFLEQSREAGVWVAILFGQFCVSWRNRKG